MSLKKSLYDEISHIRLRLCNMIDYLDFHKSREYNDLMSYPSGIAEEINKELEKLQWSSFVIRYANDEKSVKIPTYKLHEEEESSDENIYEEIRDINFEEKTDSEKIEPLEIIDDKDDDDDDNNVNVKEMYDTMLNKAHQDKEYPILFNAYKGPFVDKTKTGYYSCGDISDSYGVVMELKCKQPYIRELHQYIVQNIIDILNDKETEWEGPRPKFHHNKTIEIGILEFELKERAGSKLIDQSKELFDYLIYKILDKEEYINYCINCIPDYIKTNIYKDIKDWQYKELEYDDLTEAAKDAALYLSSQQAKYKIKNMEDKVRVDFETLPFTSEIQKKVEEEYSHFFSLPISAQTAEEKQKILSESFKEITGFEENIENDICIWSETEKRLFIGNKDYEEFIEEHKVKETDIIIPKINTEKHNYCILSPEDLKSNIYENYVAETDDDVYWRVFMNSKRHAFTFSPNNDYIRIIDFIKNVSFHLDENNINEFSTENVIPIEFKSVKKRMIDIASHASANIFVMTGIAIIPGRIKYAMTRYKQKKNEDPGLDAVEYYREIIRDNISCSIINQKTVDSIELSDDMIKAIFIL